MKHLASLIVAILALPAWTLAEFSCNLPKSHEFGSWLSKREIRGDFDNDGATDTARLVIEKKTSKHGIAVCHGRSRSISFIAAGSNIGNGGDDFYWMDRWEIRSGPIGQGASEEAPPKFKGEALYVAKSGSASAVIYFDGKNFQWYQQGD